MQLAEMRITSELLVELLHLPLFTTIKGARMNVDGQDVVLLLENSDFPEKDTPSQVNPQFKKYDPQIQFVDWGIRP